MSDRTIPITEAFWIFHKANPHVYDRLVSLAREWKAKGNKKCGIKMLFEVLRWQNGLKTTGEQYLLNNNYHALYARLILDREPDLAGIFELRAITEYVEPDSTLTPASE